MQGSGDALLSLSAMMQPHPRDGNTSVLSQTDGERQDMPHLSKSLVQMPSLLLPPAAGEPQPVP